MRPPTIYIPQRPHPDYLEDITNKAVKYGEIRVLLGRGQIIPLSEQEERAPWMITPEDAVERLARGLADACHDDYILAIGDPVAIGIAITLMAAQTGGHVNILKWDRQNADYYAVPVQLPKGSVR